MISSEAEVDLGKNSVPGGRGSTAGRDTDTTLREEILDFIIISRCYYHHSSVVVESEFAPSAADVVITTAHHAGDPARFRAHTKLTTNYRMPPQFSTPCILPVINGEKIFGS